MTTPAFYTAEQVAARLRKRLGWFRQHRAELIAKHGFPPADAALELWSAAAVEAWIASRVPQHLRAFLPEPAAGGTVSPPPADFFAQQEELDRRSRELADAAAGARGIRRQAATVHAFGARP